MKSAILAIVGDRYHAASVLRKGLAPLGDQFAISFVEKPAEVPWAGLRSFSAILLSKGGYDQGEPGMDDWLNAKSSRLADYVETGGGLLLLHSGVAGYDANPVMLGLARASFSHHPPGLLLVAHQTREHAGAGFCTEDEQYFLNITRPLENVFLESKTTEHGTAPAGWRHRFGTGRICALTPGHTIETLLHPSFQTMLRANLSWCAGLSAFD